VVQARGHLVAIEESRRHIGSWLALPLSFRGFTVSCCELLKEANCGNLLIQDTMPARSLSFGTLFGTLFGAPFRTKWVGFQ